MKKIKFLSENKISKRISIIEELTVNSTKSRIIKFLFYFVLFTHLSTFFWIFQSKIDFPNWVTISNFHDYRDYELYICSLYFIITSIFTVGYGDVISVSVYERLYNIFLMIVGVFLYPYAITSLSYLLAYRDSKTKIFNTSLDTLEDIKD